MSKPESGGPKPPSLVPGVVLLALAAILIVVVLINPPMASWGKSVVAAVAVGVVVALLGYAVYVFHSTTKRGRK